MSAARTDSLTFLRVTRSSVSRVLWTVGVVTLIACSDRQGRVRTRRASPMETAIARDLTARFSTPVTVTCMTLVGVPIGCSGTLADGTKLTIVVESASKHEWAWRIDGRVVESKVVVAYVQEHLAAIGVAQTATCGPSAITVAKPGERIPCTLSGGGAAFVEVAPDGSTTLELDLDPASAAARSEIVTPDRDRGLTEQSKALETLEWESDGEEAVISDAGVPAD